MAADCAAPSTIAQLENEPFVLFDDAQTSRAARPARLYKDPLEIIEVHRLEDVTGALDLIDRRVRQGCHAAGYLAYEAGFAFEPRLARQYADEQAGQPLLWFGLFDTPTLAEPDILSALGQTREIATERQLASAKYEAAVSRVLAYVHAGDCYQVNLTFPSTVTGIDDPFALYHALRSRQAGGWGGMLSTGDRHLLSLSPELYFAIADGRIVAKPMKGTAPRSADRVQDQLMRAQLAQSIKDRAENLMIVDLLRNDIARVSVPSSMEVSSLFEIEDYPTVFQMTSTIEARLRPGLNAIDALRATFPCGSVTGAPKVRAMEIISEVESQPRGAYTGSMGFIAPDGTSAFNVLIRTLEMKRGSSAARIGLGSAIVADSEAQLEWAECAAKARFLGGSIR